MNHLFNDEVFYPLRRFDYLGVLLIVIEGLNVPTHWILSVVCIDNRGRLTACSKTRENYKDKHDFVAVEVIFE